MKSKNARSSSPLGPNETTFKVFQALPQATLTPLENNENDFEEKYNGRDTPKAYTWDRQLLERCKQEQGQFLVL